MPATYTSSFTHNQSLSQSGSAAPEGGSVDTFLQSLNVSTGPSSSSEEDMALQLGGDATAVGTDTFASAQAQVVVKGDANVQSAHASTEITAWGSGVGAYASTTSYADIIGDADHTFSLSFTTEQTHQTGDFVEWQSTSMTEVFALDIDGVPNSAAPTTPAAGTPDPAPQTVPPPPVPAGDGCGCGSNGGGDWNVDGNVVVFDIEATAIGDNSLALVDLSAITVDDQLSSVTFVVTAAIG